jgi:hypothetical protein
VVELKLVRPQRSASMGPSRSFLLLALLLSASTLSGCGDHPSSAALIQQWRDHHEEFDEALQMFLGDKKLGRVAPDFTRPDDPSTIGVPADRIGRYRSLLSAAHVSAGIEGYDPKDEVWYRVSTRGLAISGSSKGIAWRSTPPEPPHLLVDDLDAFLAKTFPGHPKSFTAYQRIEDNWYLYYDYED